MARRRQLHKRTAAENVVIEFILPDTRSKRKAVVIMSSAVKDRAERLFRQQQEGTKALSEYQAKEEATRLLTAKLRAERLAREASSKPERDRKKPVR
jgi:hypothetical protein